VRGIRYEHEASAAADAARALWRRGEDAISAIEWALARDPQAGQPYANSEQLRFSVFDGAKSIGLPSVDVLFVSTPEQALIIEMDFY